MKKQPYQTSDDGKFWDYNFRLRGIVYEISVNKTTGEMFINPDQDPEVKLFGGVYRRTGTKNGLTVFSLKKKGVKNVQDHN